MKNKVYCKNCKFEIYTGRPVTRKWYCSRDNKVNSYIGYIIEIEKDFSSNTYGKCNYYQRKWWKFWL